MESQIDFVGRLRGLSEEELREYVRRRLRGDPSDPPVVSSLGEVPQTFLVTASRASTDDAPFQERLGRVVTALLKNWRPGAETVEYLMRLANLAGDIGAANADIVLRSLIENPAVPDAEVDGRDLRAALLRALLAFSGQEQDEGFWKQYFDDPRRADVAFLAAYRRNPLRAVEYFERYVSTALDRLPPGAFRLRLANYVLDYLKVENLQRLALAIPRLDSEKRERVLEILRSLDIGEQAWKTFEKALEAPEQVMTTMQKLKNLFQRADVPAETREVFARAESTKELMKGLQDLRGRNELELRENEEQLIPVEKALALEEDRVRKGGLTSTEETTVLRRIQRLETQRGILENLVAIYHQNVTLHLNLLAKIRRMEALRLRGVSEDEVDRLVEEVEDNLETYKRVSLAAESGPVPVQAVDRSAERGKLDEIKKRILASKESHNHAAPEPHHEKRDLE